MILGLLEATLYIDDLDAADAFYGGLLGLERITRQDGRHAFYRCGQTVVLLFIAAETERPQQNPDLPVPPHGARGPGHLCFSVMQPALSLWPDRLAEAGVAVEADFCWPNGARSIYVRDPAGNSIEFAEPALWGIEIKREM